MWAVRSKTPLDLDLVATPRPCRALVVTPSSAQWAANPKNVQAAGPTCQPLDYCVCHPSPTHAGYPTFPQKPLPSSAPRPKGSKASSTFLEVIKVFFKLLEKTFDPE